MSLVPTWVALSLAASLNGGSYWPCGVVLLCAAAFWLYRPSRRLADQDGQQRSLWCMAAAGAGLGLVLAPRVPQMVPNVFHQDGGTLQAIIVAGYVLVFGILLTYLPGVSRRITSGRLRLGRLRFALLLTAVAAQGAAAIGGFPNPPIDVFNFLTEGLRGLLQGLDPYAMQFTRLPEAISVGYQDPAYHFDVYAYLPATLLLTAPGVLLGDVRWGMLGAVLLSALLLRQVAIRMGRSAEHAELGAAVFVCYPGLLHVLQQAWVEPLIVAVWMLGVWVQLVSDKRQLASGLIGGVLLATKQFTAPLLLPVVCLGMRMRLLVVSCAVATLFILPFFVWNPRAFVWDAVQYQLQAPSREDALSLNGLLLNLVGVDLPGVVSAGMPAMAAAWAAVGVLRGVSSGETFRRVAGFYLLSFLFGKFAFANYYFLTQVVVLMAAIAPHVAPQRTRAYPPLVAGVQCAAPRRRARVLVFIVAYNASRTIEWVLSRIPEDLNYHDTEVLIIDDASQDDTFAVAERVRQSGEFGFNLHVLANPVNQGYGGNQKLGFLYAIEHGFEVVALVHGDGQYAPEALAALIAPLVDGDADAVFGSRMTSWTGALRGGMPVYKYIGNRVLTYVQNVLLGSNLTEFHSGYRLYSVGLLKRIPFQLNSNGFHFDTEIIIQLLLLGARLRELPIPTYYGDEKCYVNGIKYAWDVVRASVAARLQRFNLIYRRNFDLSASRGEANAHYVSKLHFTSTHSYAISAVRTNETVVDIGCAGGYLAQALHARGCTVIGIDRYRPATTELLHSFYQRDLDREALPACISKADVVLLLDVLEHLRSPETFMDQLRTALSSSPSCRVVLSTGNIGFIVTRLMLLLGQFNYGKRGILDLTHTRLFTFASVQRLLQESGFQVERVRGVPAPIFEVVHDGWAANWLMRLNQVAIRVSRGLFSYQIFVVAHPLPTLTSLLRASEIHTHDRSQAVAVAAGQPHPRELVTARPRRRRQRVTLPH